MAATSDSDTHDEAGATRACPDCGTEAAPGLLACPSCGRLVHGAELRALAADAEAATRDGETVKALVAWRAALALLPVRSRQHEVIVGKIEALARRVDAPNAPAVATADAGSAAGAASVESPSWARRAGPFGVVALLAWKLKSVAVLLFAEGKLLLLGVGKGTTFLSMLLSLGVYWSVYGWRFAAGLIASIYVHEMGHVAALRRYGIAATAPMFIPGFGAVVRLKQYPTNPIEDARVGLAGPIWGLGAAVVAYLIAKVTGSGAWAAIASVGAWINLFNLVPIWQLDGSRGFAALSRSQRWMVAAVVGATWAATDVGMLGIVLLVAVGRALSPRAPDRPDRTTFVQFALLVVALGALAATGSATARG